MQTDAAIRTDAPSPTDDATRIDASAMDAGALVPDARSSTGADSGACEVAVVGRAIEGAGHVEACSTVSYQSNPPSSGNHYGNWAAFGEYAFPLPRGFWVHNLEHGAIVITFNCPDGCDQELAEVRAWFDALPVDPPCLGTTTRPRAILTPDPLLDARWAASAWGWTLTAACFDAAAFSAFYDAHVGMGREDVCTPGLDYRDPSGGPSASLPSGCVPQ
jgi:hypothetical protein